jgi:hypothetical protein
MALYPLTSVGGELAPAGRAERQHGVGAVVPGVPDHDHVVPGPDLYAVPAGIPAHRRYGQVQISERIGHRIEVTAEDDDFRERQEPGRVGVVAAGTLDDLREKTGGGGAANRLPEAGIGQHVALDRGSPPVVTCGACHLSALDVSRCSNARMYFRAASSPTPRMPQATWTGRSS